jgi:hypothetical protein
MRTSVCWLAGKCTLHLLHRRLRIACTAAILTYMAGKKGLGKPSLLRHLITAYMVITGIVEASPQDRVVSPCAAWLAELSTTAYAQVLLDDLLVTNVCCRSPGLCGTCPALVSFSRMTICLCIWVNHGRSSSTLRVPIHAALVWAALHNLAEWGIIGFTVFQVGSMP